MKAFAAAYPETIEPNRKRRSAWLDGVVLLIGHLANIWVAFDIASAIGRANMDRAKLLALDSYAYKHHVELSMRNGDIMVTLVHVTRPNPGTMTINSVIGNRQRLGLKCGDRHNWTQKFLLENPHLVVAFQDRRLDIDTLGQFTVEPGRVATNQHFGTFFAANGEIGQDFSFCFLLACAPTMVSGLRGSPCLMANKNKAFDSFIQKRIVFAHYIREKDVGAFTAMF
ncbi:MAG: hypothetical protein ACI8Q6_003159 [Granulosicoccus sp.]|jgi:hypothetical protein